MDRCFVRKSAKGFLRFEHVNGKTRAVSQRFSYPLRFFVSEWINGRDQDFVVLNIASYGGGLVGGDLINVILETGANCNVIVTTQGNTKVYKRASSEGCYQNLSVRIFEDAILCWIPHPVTAFKDSILRQKQNYDVHRGGSLIALDWFTSGRFSCGERWKFEELTSLNQIVYNGEVLVDDNTKLRNEVVDESTNDGTCENSVENRMKNYDVFGTLLPVGSKLDAIASHILQATER